MLATKLLRDAKQRPRTTWKRAAGNPILSPGATWEGGGSGFIQEPSVIYESGTWKLWYTGNITNTAVGYATCTSDPTVAANWTKYASNPVLGQGGSSISGFASGINVVKVGSTYYAYYYDTAGGGNLKVSTSSDGIAWGTPSTALASGTPSWMPGGWANCFVWNEGGTTWKMLVEGSTHAGGGQPWAIAYATSTDGITWAVVGSGPLTSLAYGGYTGYSGPWLANGGAKVNGRYQLWYHADNPGNSNFSSIVHAYSTDAQNWTITGLELEANGSSIELQQVADPSVLEVAGITYLFYDGIDNTGGHGYINVATYPSSISDLVLWET